MYHKAVSRKPCPESLEAYTFKGGNLWPVALRLLENRLARCLDCIEQAITLRNSRVGGNHKGPDGLGGVDLPILDPKNLLHVFLSVVADRCKYAKAFFSNPSKWLIRRNNAEIEVFNVWWQCEISPASRLKPVFYGRFGRQLYPDRISQYRYVPLRFFQ